MKRIFKSLMVVAAFVFVLALTGCNDNKNSLVGNWYYLSGESVSETIYYTFNADKTGGYTFGGSTSKFTYEDDGTKLSIQYESATVPNEFEYKIENGVLIIKDSLGSDVTYKKK